MELYEQINSKVEMVQKEAVVFLFSVLSGFTLEAELNQGTIFPGFGAGNLQM